MDALGDRAILRCHLRDRVEERLQPVGLLGALLALGAQLRGALLHRGTLRGGEAAGPGLRTLRGHLPPPPFDLIGSARCRPAEMKARPAATAAASRFVTGREVPPSVP